MLSHRGMRHLLPACLVCLLGAYAFAGEPQPPLDPLQAALARNAELEQELLIAELRAEKDRLVIEALERFGEHLIQRVARKGAPGGREEGELRARILTLEDRLAAERQRTAAQVAGLEKALANARKRLEQQGAKLQEVVQQLRLEISRSSELEQVIRQGVEKLRDERKRHARDLTALRKDLDRAHAVAKESRELAARQQKKADVEQAKSIEIHKEMERLRWNYTRGAPKGSVARMLSFVPASYWREALAAGGTRARVALTVLAVLPDRTPETLKAIVDVISSENAQLDTATRAIVAIGAPAVPRLVAAARKAGARGSPPRAWLAYTFGEMGPAAKDALPWLEELARVDHRDAAQAERAIARIRNP